MPPSWGIGRHNFGYLWILFLRWPNGTKLTAFDLCSIITRYPSCWKTVVCFEMFTLVSCVYKLSLPKSTCNYCHHLEAAPPAQIKRVKCQKKDFDETQLWEARFVNVARWPVTSLLHCPLWQSDDVRDSVAVRCSAMGPGPSGTTVQGKTPRLICCRYVAVCRPAWCRNSNEVNDVCVFIEFCVFGWLIRSGAQWSVCFNIPSDIVGLPLSSSLDSCFVLFCLVVCFIEWQATLQQHTAMLSKSVAVPNKTRASNTLLAQSPQQLHWFYKVNRPQEEQRETKQNKEKHLSPPPADVCVKSQREKLCIPWWRMLQD